MDEHEDLLDHSPHAGHYQPLSLQSPAPATPPHHHQTSRLAQVLVINSQSPVILTLFVLFWTIETIVSGIVVVTQHDVLCEVPLRMWITVFTGRLLISAPLRVYAFYIQRQGQTLPRKVVKLDSLFELLILIWFVCGQYWIFGAKECPDTAPTLYYYSLILVLMTYSAIALPLMVVMLFCLCLPCICVGIRLMGGNICAGASDRAINDIPRGRYTGPSAGDDGDLCSRGSSRDSPMCAICMCEFQIGETIRTLPCNHQFHIGCVDRWLKIKKECPLCRTSITSGA